MGTFASVTRIGTVDLARNQITAVHYQMFQQSKYAEVRIHITLMTNDKVPPENDVKYVTGAFSLYVECFITDNAVF